MSTMANDTLASLIAPASTMSLTAARIAFAGGATSLALLAALHVLRRDLAPSSHMVSEYAVGAHGWVMGLCFLALAIGCASLFVVVRPAATTLAGKIGLAFLVAAVVGLALASIFPMDPITVKPENATTSGKMHGVAGMIGIPSLVIAAVILSYVLRRHPTWAPVRLPLLAMAHLNWISVTLMFALVGILMKEGTAGLGGLMGYANRLLMLAYCGWVMVTAWPVLRGGRG